MNCPLCNSSESSIEKRLSAFVQTDKRTSLWRCSECDFVFRENTPLPVSDSQKREFPVNLKYGEYTAGTTHINARLKARLVYLEKTLPDESKRILDIGAGTGTFVKAATKRGWDAFGTELENEERAHNIYSVNLLNETCPEIEKESFDVVHIHHVLEHVSDPLALLQCAGTYLKRGGLLIVEVPNEIKSLASEIKMLLGKKYNSSTAYFDHRLFFDASSLKFLLGKLDTMKLQHFNYPFIAEGMSLGHRLLDRIQSIVRRGATLECILQKK